MKEKVVLVGWSPAVVDYSKYPNFTSEMLESRLKLDEKLLNDDGYNARLEFIFDNESAVIQLSKLFGEEHFDIVLIGAGVRKDDSCFDLFEKIINIVHEKAPKSKICFNTNPTDSFDAVKRWSKA